MGAFISKDEVLGKLSNDNIRIVDCRFQLGNPTFGVKAYEEGHIPGAVYFHLEKDLSGEVAEHGGRHPLPEMGDFQQVLEEAGISNDTEVIAYDGGEGAFAARLWWLLKYVGHEKVHILDGGFKEWATANYPTTVETHTYPRANFNIHIQEEMLVSVEEVKQATIDEKTILIDSRENRRYLGLEEPIDKKCGHIPTAINKVWMEAFENGRFKSPDGQAERFADLDKDQPMIVYCGSGVTATPNYIALKEAGFSDVKLYAGSFSDWISYTEHEVHTGK